MKNRRAQLGRIQPASNLSAFDERDQAGLFGDDDGNRVGIFRDTDGGAVARAEVFRETRIECQRQEAGSRCDTMPPNDDRAVMERRGRVENRDEQIVTEFGFELNAAVCDVLKAYAALDNDKRARLR